MKFSDVRNVQSIEYHLKVYVLSWISGVFVIGSISRQQVVVVFAAYYVILIKKAYFICAKY
jgi:hypothetical protein